MTKIQRTTTVEECVHNYPQTVRVFMKHGVKALVCGEPAWGTVEELLKNSGKSDDEIEEILKELNTAAEEGGTFNVGGF
jgi:methionine synthase II (cobalamin-independent)